MIVVDTNVLYALADRRDKHHAECTEWFRRNDDVLLVLPTVVAEACYLIDRYLGPAAEAAFLDSVGNGDNYAFQLAELADWVPFPTGPGVTFADRTICGLQAGSFRWPATKSKTTSAGA